ncbi:MAG: flagellar hook-associated protein FlgL, partial [Planctomycetota bacterium]
MNLRPTQAGTYSLVRMGLTNNTRLLTEYQEQIATGRRILRVSDDVVGATRALAVRRQLENVGRHRDSITAGRSRIDAAAGSLERGSSILAEARSLMILGMNGTASQADRETYATQLEQAIGELFDTVNTESNGSYLFSGTETEQPAFERRTVGGRERIVYAGNEEQQRLTVGVLDEAVLNVTGTEAFGRFEYTGAALEGLTGLTLGSSANQGTGDAYIEIRRDGVTGAPGAGVVFAGGGAEDTFLGDHVIEINAADRTVSFSGGDPVSIGDPLPDDLVLYGDNG